MHIPLDALETLLVNVCALSLTLLTHYLHIFSNGLLGAGAAILSDSDGDGDAIRAAERTTIHLKCIVEAKSKPCK